ncbi:MAG: cytochrome C oxidase subunit IV family protein, partial [Tepidisphaeraceae bacterium]
VYVLLMLLLVLTVGASFVHLGDWNVVLAMSIAVIKALLVVLFFMHVLQGGRLVWLFAGSAFLWLAILLVLTLNDYMTRSDIPRGAPADMMGTPSVTARHSLADR